MEDSVPKRPKRKETPSERAQRRGRSARDAETLNTAQVYARFGLDRGKLYYECKRFDETRGSEGLPYIRIAGRMGRKGTLLFRLTDLNAFLDRHTRGFEMEGDDG